MWQALDEFARAPLEHLTIYGVITGAELLLMLGFVLTVRLSRRRRHEPRPTRSFLLDALLPIRVAKDAQASLEELMPIWTEAHGAKRARRIRRAQTIGIVVGHYALPVIAFGERILKIVSARGSAE